VILPIMSWTTVSAGLFIVIRPDVLKVMRDAVRVQVRRVRLQVGSQVSRRHESDLAICGLTSDSIAVRKTVNAFTGGIVGIGVSAASGAAAVGGTAIGVLLPVGGIVLGYFVPDLTLMRDATRRRKSFRFAFSSFLDLVTVLLAGGAGIESAMLAASESGDGFAFEQIRDGLRRSQVARTSAWDELARLGRKFRIDEVVEIAGSVELAGRHGARIRETLVARATTLRQRQLSEIEADAAAATERMGMPMVLLFIGFITLVGYPAVAEMLRGW
jgi:tight adherence protein C